ncbi:muscarinic acetylcholine receptor M5-like [Diadema antillarum]|uniref:muscarinic acetylcholine receptor M5-like n=1 Tax=Diadema antillarum TaxID=105358 RepID=UPI003A87207D
MENITSFVLASSGNTELDNEDTLLGLVREARVGVKFIITAIIAAMTVFMNALILVAFAVQKKLRTYNNYYIINMTIADLTVGALVMPVRLTIYLYDGWIFSRLAGLLFLALQNATLGVSVFGIVVITIDRYVATLYPMMHYMKRSKRIAIAVNVLTWLLPAIVWLFLNVVWDFLEPNKSTNSSGLPRPNFSRSLLPSTMIFCLRLGGPFLLILVLYLRVYHEIRKRGNDRRARAMLTSPTSPNPKETHIGDDEAKPETPSNPHNTPPPESHRNGPTSPSAISVDGLANSKTVSYPNKSSYGNGAPDVSDAVEEVPPHSRKKRSVASVPAIITRIKQYSDEHSSEGRKAMRTLTFILVAFVLSWLPNTVNIIIFSFDQDLYRWLNATIGFSEISRWISYCNSLINPLAYAMALPLLRETIAIMFYRRWK